MCSVLIRISAIASIVLLLSGCGDSSGNGGNGGGGGGSPTTVTVSFTGATPTAVATQIGSGSYASVTPASSITLTLPSGTTNFAVAYVCTVSFPPSGAGPSVEIFQNIVEASATDGTNLLEKNQCATPAGPAAGLLTGSIDGSAVPGVTFLAVSGTVLNLGNPSTSSSFSIQEPLGPQRIMVTAYGAVSSPPAQAGSTTLLAARNFDNQPVPGALNNGNTVVLGPADVTTSQTITYNGVPSGFATSADVGYGTSAELVTSDAGSVLLDPATTQYPVLPSAATESGDYYLVSTLAGNENETMQIGKTSSTAIPIIFTFPPTWGFPGPTPAALPTFNVAYAGFPGGSGLDYQVGFYWDPDSDTRVFFYISASGNYLNGAHSITFPDLTGLQGFSKPASGSAIPWNAAISQTVYDSTPSSSANATVTTISDMGTYTVP